MKNERILAENKKNTNGSYIIKNRDNVLAGEDIIP